MQFKPRAKHELASTGAFVGMLAGLVMAEHTVSEALGAVKHELARHLTAGDGVDQRALRVAEDGQLVAVDGLDGAGAPASANFAGDDVAGFEVVHGCLLLSVTRAVRSTSPRGLGVKASYTTVISSQVTPAVILGVLPAAATDCSWYLPWALLPICAPVLPERFWL